MLPLSDTLVLDLTQVQFLAGFEKGRA